MAGLFHNIFSRPEVEAAVRADPKLIPLAVEESLRLDAPFYGFFRRTTKATTLSGTQLAAGETVGLNWASANRDPAAFDQPEHFRLDRLRNKHVAFGYGIHTCVGAPLARLEMKVALQQVLTRLPGLRITAAAHKYFGGASVVYVDAVHVRFTPPGNKPTD